MICRNFTGEAQGSTWRPRDLYDCVQCIAEQQHVRSLGAGTGTAHRERSHPESAVGSEHTSEAQDNKDV